MKKLLISMVTIFTLMIVFAGGVYANMNWLGSQDVQQAKDKIIQVSDLFRNKNKKIENLENEKKEFNKQLDDKNKQLDDKNKQLADKDKINADKDKVIAEKEREKVQLQNTLIQKDNKISELERVIDELKNESGNKDKAYEEQLKQAKQDVEDINELLKNLLENNK